MTNSFKLSFNQSLLCVFLLFCAGLSVFSFYHSINKPFTLDETDITNRANMVISHGPKGPEIVFGKDAGETMPHPPLYEYTIALLFRLFGEKEAVARGFGIFCFVIASACTAGMIQFLLKEESPFLRRLMTGMGVALFLVNPLLIQHSMLIDADGAYTFLFVSIFAYLYMRLEQPFSKNYILSRLPLAGILAMTYLSKEYTPFFISFGMLSFRLLNREWKKLLADFLFVFALGMGLAWTAWFLFTYLTGIDPLIFIKQQSAHRISKFGGENLIGKVFLRNLTTNLTYVSRWPIFWGSAPFHVLLGLCLVSRILAFFKKWKLTLADYCLITACIIWIPYLLVKPSIDMMKYQHPIYPLFIVVICTSVCGWLKPIEQDLEETLKKNTWVLPVLIAILAGLTFYYYKLDDYIRILFEPKDSFRWKTFFTAYFKPFLFIWALCLIVRKKFFLPILTLATLLLIFPIQFALNLRQTAPYTTVESWLNYGESGLRETAQYLSTRVTADMKIGVRKDLEYYLRVKYGVKPALNYDPVYLFDAKRMQNMFVAAFQGKPFRYIVVDQASMLSAGRPNADGEKLLSLYKKDASFGTFVVLKWDGDEKLKGLIS